MKNLIFIFVLVLLIPAAALAQGTGFNFQGRLNDGANPANGSYNLQFSLFNQINGGTQIGSTIARPNTALINGVFSVTLDFGATAFNNPNTVFIEIGVKPAGSPNAFTILGPRQQLTVVPFAIQATNAVNADYAFNANNAQNAQTALVATNAENASLAANSNTLNGLSSSDFIRNSVAPIANQNFNIVGNGVINGTLNVAGNTTIGSPTITSDLNVSGKITAAGNVAQNRDKSGLVKAMLYVDQFGNIVRCYNGVTDSSTGNCGFTVTHGTGSTEGFNTIDFGFRVNDRFVAVTPGRSSVVTIVASFLFISDYPNRIFVETNITDIDHSNSNTADDFMIIVY